MYSYSARDRIQRGPVLADQPAQRRIIGPVVEAADPPRLPMIGEQIAALGRHPGSWLSRVAVPAAALADNAP